MPTTDIPKPQDTAGQTPEGLPAKICSGEVVHGFTLEPGQDASSLRWWPEFVEYFERVEGITPHPRDTQHKRLFEYFVQGAFCQWESQNDQAHRQTGAQTNNGDTDS